MHIYLGTALTDYKVSVGVGYCTVTFLYGNLLKCRLPAELPAAGRDYTVDPDNENKRLPAVRVSK